jgi:secondary thiamine-phosphate synthase enzyme
MKIFTREIALESTEKTDFIDVTKLVKDFIAESNVKSGIANIYTTHTTTAIRINENESGLIEDAKKYLEESAPRFTQYKHDDMEERKNVPEDEPSNAHSHLKSIILGASETIPIINSQIMLGQWQSILFVDLDGPRKRKMYLHVIGQCE